MNFEQIVKAAEEKLSAEHHEFYPNHYSAPVAELANPLSGIGFAILALAVALRGLRSQDPSQP